MRWLKVIKINSDKECMIAIFSFLLFLLYEPLLTTTSFTACRN